MKKTIIIAEAGVNHNGNLEMAKKLVDVAMESGVDFVKFQTAIPKELVSKYANKARYQIENTGTTESQLEMLNKLMLPFAAYKELNRYCKSNEIGFISTPFDIESIHFLDEFEMPFWKIPSGEVTNYPYLREIAKTKIPIVMSTGMCSIEEIQAAINVITYYTGGKITLLQCNTQYPTPMQDVNLRAMLTLKKEFGVPVGFSDHTKGIEVPIAAVALGAEIIEKHFTLDRNLPGPDHKASLEPNELSAMVSAIRNIEIAIGTGEKIPTNSELSNRDIARKSIVAKRAIQKGEKYSEENLTTKRPGIGISPMKWDKIIGKKANKAYEEDELIDEN